MNNDIIYYFDEGGLLSYVLYELIVLFMLVVNKIEGICIVFSLF